MHTKDTNSKTKTTGIHPFIINIICMRLSETESLDYLSDKGYDISRAELYRLKKEVDESTQERLNLIASSEFLTQHMERIDTLKTIHDELWANYNLENNPSKRVHILMQIVEMQVYLSSYYDSTRYVMEQGAKIKDKKKRKEVTYEES